MDAPVDAVPALPTSCDTDHSQARGSLPGMLEMSEGDAVSSLHPGQLAVGGQTLPLLTPQWNNLGCSLHYLRRCPGGSSLGCPHGKLLINTP